MPTLDSTTPDSTTPAPTTASNSPTSASPTLNPLTSFLNSHWPITIILVLATIIRFYQIDLKPLHSDEGVDGQFIEKMKVTGFYAYNPKNFHGPLPYYTLFVAAQIFGHSVFALRFFPCISGIALAYTVSQFFPFIGRLPSLIATLFIAIGPAFTYYSIFTPHQIQETLFTAILLLGVSHLLLKGSKKGLYLTFFGATGAALTRETHIIQLIALILSFAATYLYQYIPFFPNKAATQKVLPPAQQWTRHDFLTALTISLFSLVYFYTGGFHDFSLFKGTWQTYTLWVSESTANHMKPWTYWWKLFATYEWPAFPALIITFITLFRKPFHDTFPIERFLAFFTLAILCAYSLIAYKTPWCIVSILMPVSLFLLPSNFTFSQPKPQHVALLLLLLSPLLHATNQSLRINFTEFENPDEPYVYVQATSDTKTFAALINQAITLNPEARNMSGHVAADAYPICWLTRLPNVGWSEKLPHTPLSQEFLLVPRALVKETESRLKGSYYTTILNLRPNKPSKLYLKQDVFPFASHYRSETF